MRSDNPSHCTECGYFQFEWFTRALEEDESLDLAIFSWYIINPLQFLQGRAWGFTG